MASAAAAAGYKLSGYKLTGALQFEQVSATSPEFQYCIEIRIEVFVNEQNVPLEEERDADDAAALHFLALKDGAAIGTARVVLKYDGAAAKIGRVAVLKSARGLGVGAALIRHIERTVSSSHFVLDAQTHASTFYERLGYTAIGEEFMEAGIPHFRMIKDRSTSLRTR